MSWTAKLFTPGKSVSTGLLMGLVYEGHDPYGMHKAGALPNDAVGIVAYFDEPLLFDLIDRLNAVTPPYCCACDNGVLSWHARWTAHLDLDEGNEADFVRSARKGELVAVYSDAQRKGFALKACAAQLYLILALLNAGPLPEGVVVNTDEVS